MWLIIVVFIVISDSFNWICYQHGRCYLFGGVNKLLRTPQAPGPALPVICNSSGSHQHPRPSVLYRDSTHTPSSLDIYVYTIRFCTIPPCKHTEYHESRGIFYLWPNSIQSQCHLPYTSGAQQSRGTSPPVRVCVCKLTLVCHTQPPVIYKYHQHI